MAKLRIIGLFLAVLLLDASEGRIRHCFECRSRGELGDCKDPFGHNVTTVDGVRGVEATPCASGWCGKIVEGGNEDLDTATERICVQRPPVDGEERCSDTVIDRKPVYMCFCMGDLCNDAAISGPSFAILFLSLVLMVYRRICSNTH